MPQPEPIDPGKYSFPTLMNDIENGRVRLPPFQWEFVWSLGKVIDLMDSIYKGFPIGSFFYWKADREYVKLFRDIKSLSLPPPAPDQVHQDRIHQYGKTIMTRSFSRGLN